LRIPPYLQFSFKVAQENFNIAGLSDRISLILGPAAETLPTLSSEEPFDLMFIDADKASIPIYFKEAKRLVRKGGVVVRVARNLIFLQAVASPNAFFRSLITSTNMDVSAI